MSSQEHVLYIQGVGPNPEVQNRLTELWLPLGLTVEYWPFEWDQDDYDDRIASIGDRIIELTKRTETTVDVVGASGGGQPVLDLLGRHPDKIRRAAIINTKVEPYDPESTGWQALPNLVKASGAVLDNVTALDGLLDRVLCVHSRVDRTVDPASAVIPGAHELTLPVDGHIDGIEYTLTIGSEAIATFLREGAVPPTPV